MSRTKQSARKGPEGHAARQKAKEAKKKQEELKKANHDKQKAQLGNTTAPITGSDEMSIDPIAEPVTSANTTTDTKVQPFGDLANTHDVLFISITSSTQIQKKATATLNHLPGSPAKPAVVMLRSKAKVASKLITVVEIAKREIAGGGGKWYQYNVVERSLEERERESGGEAVEEDGEEESFETMKTPFERAIEGTKVVRAVPGMTTYLARVRIEGLRKEYGEQTNE